MDASADFYDLIERITGTNNASYLSELAQSLLESQESLWQAAGYVMLAQSGRLDTNTITALAYAQNLITPFTVLEWLNDAHCSDSSSELELLLRERLKDPYELLDLLSSGELSLGGNRSAIWILRCTMNDPELNAFYRDLATDEKQDYETRMRSLLELSHLEFSEDFVKDLKRIHQTTTNNAVWQENLDRFRDRMMAMKERNPTNPIMGPDAIQTIIKTNYPLQIEDTALFLEYIADHWASLIQPGTCSNLYAAMPAWTNRLLTAADKRAYQRIMALQNKLELIEHSRWPE
jgi:hypothetical protein